MPMLAVSCSRNDICRSPNEPAEASSITALTWPSNSTGKTTTLVGMALNKPERIGTAVSLAPFYHPLRLAEEVALLDVLSGGRVNWGAGRGFSRGEFTAFGVPPEESTERFRENVEIVLRAWTEELRAPS